MDHELISKDKAILETNNVIGGNVEDIRSILNKIEGAEVHFSIDYGHPRPYPYPTYELIITFLFTSIVAGFLSEIGKDAWNELKNKIKSIWFEKEKVIADWIESDFIIEIIYNNEDIYYRQYLLSLSRRNTTKDTLDNSLNILLDNICRLEADPLSWEPSKPNGKDLYPHVEGIQPLNAYSWCNKGRSFHRLGKYKEAINAYNQAIKLAPDYSEAYFSKGLALKALNSISEADTTFAKAEELRHKHKSYRF